MGDWRMCSNYKGFTLINLIGKVYEGMLQKKVLLIGEPQIEEEQCFLCTLDQLHTLTKIVECIVRNP